MDTQEYIESGTLELYVYGILNESETKEISDLAKTNIEIQNETATQTFEKVIKEQVKDIARSSLQDYLIQKENQEQETKLASQ